MSHAPRRTGRPSRLTPVTTAILSAFLLLAITAVSVPGTVLGASVTKVAACGVNLRTSPWTTARLRAAIKTDTKVTVATTVSGGGWRAMCAGRSVSGKAWYRISAVNGRSVKSLYGVTYLYAASGLFKDAVTTTPTPTPSATPTPIPTAAPTVTKYAACTANLRTSASVSATARTLIGTDTKVTVVTSVTGGSWVASCTGPSASGTSWYQISAVNGTSVTTLYGVTYLYAASGLFKDAVTSPTTSIATPAPIPTAAPTAAPTTAPAAAPTTILAAAVSTPAPAAAPTPAPTATPTPTSSPSPSPSPAPVTTTEGIDVSNWQGTIDWTQVSAAGKRFAYLKASEDTSYVDPTYLTNRAQARAAGIYIGAYHFAQPSATLGDAIAEADHFLDTATPARGDLMPVLDLERANGLSQSALTAWVQAYVGRIYERLGVRTVIYCSPYFWRTYLGDTTWFAANGYKILWVAHWTSALSPIVPAGAWGGNGWTFWQYTSDGSVPGITGRVDLNRYNGTDLTRALMP